MIRRGEAARGAEVAPQTDGAAIQKALKALDRAKPANTRKAVKNRKRR
jgi:hypothetical protein